MMRAVGQPVRTSTADPRGHHRLPRYLRGQVGTIEAVHEAYPLADAVAAGQRPAPHERLYTVRFSERAVWGPHAEGDGVIFAELFESYLEDA